MTSPLTIYTIGFTKKSAEDFFKALRNSKAKHLLDIRLNNTSQLAGFTKRDDLGFFVKHLSKMNYHEMPILAPDKSVLNEYRRSKDWNKYELAYLKLLQQRHAENHIAPVLFEEGVVLLCSEAEPTYCHRRLAAEYLVRVEFPNAKIVHL